MKTEISRRQIETNLAAVQARVVQAAERAGRAPESVGLVAVTKGYPPAVIRDAHALGLCRFGENRIEEALPKLDELADLERLEWHMIGNVQSRKAGQVAERFDMVHSVDRMKLGVRLDHFAAEAGKRLPVLLECNVSGEQSKAGWPMWEREAWPDLLPALGEVLALENLVVCGLMTMAPLIADQDRVREVFRTLRDLRGVLEQRYPGHWQELSMGMSSDFEIAVEEGATLVRIGQAIFGPRP